MYWNKSMNGIWQKWVNVNFYKQQYSNMDQNQDQEICWKINNVIQLAWGKKEVRKSELSYD